MSSEVQDIDIETQIASLPNDDATEKIAASMMTDNIEQLNEMSVDPVETNTIHINTFARAYAPYLENHANLSTVPTSSAAAAAAVKISQSGREALIFEGVHMMRRVIGIAKEIMRRAGRRRLLTVDIQTAMDCCGLERPYGLTHSARIPSWRKVRGRFHDPIRDLHGTASHTSNELKERDAHYLQGPVIPIRSRVSPAEPDKPYVDKPEQSKLYSRMFLPYAPVAPVGVRMHWFAVDGSQPNVDENPTSQEVLHKALAQPRFTSDSLSLPPSTAMELFLADARKRRKGYIARASLADVDRNSFRPHIHRPTQANNGNLAVSLLQSLNEPISSSIVAPGTGTNNITPTVMSAIGDMPAQPTELVFRHVLSQEELRLVRQVQQACVDDNALFPFSKGSMAMRKAFEYVGDAPSFDIEELTQRLNAFLDVEKNTKTGCRNPIFAIFSRGSELDAVVPYIVQTLAVVVSVHTAEISKLQNAVALAYQLLLNPHLNLEPYLDRLISVLFTCAGGARLGLSVTDAVHWTVRDTAARAIHLLYSRYGLVVPTLGARILRLCEYSVAQCAKNLQAALTSSKTDEKRNANVDNETKEIQKSLPPILARIPIGALFGMMRITTYLGNHACTVCVKPQLSNLLTALYSGLRISEYRYIEAPASTKGRQLIHMRSFRLGIAVVLAGAKVADVEKDPNWMEAFRTRERDYMREIQQAKNRHTQQKTISGSQGNANRPTNMARTTSSGTTNPSTKLSTSIIPQTNTNGTTTETSTSNAVRLKVSS